MAVNTIGCFDSFIILFIARTPPRSSFPWMPSTSSSIMSLRLSLNSDLVVDAYPIMFMRRSWDLLSLALSSSLSEK